MATQVERNRLETGDTASALRLIFIVTVAVESLVAIILAARMTISYDMPLGEAAWHGLFH